MLECILEYLKAKDVEYKENIKLSDVSPIRIGGRAKMIVLPRNMSEFLNVLRFCGREKIKVKTVGGMSNILPDDVGYDGVIIKTDNLKNVEFTGDEMIAECGASLSRVAGAALKFGLSGFEELSGIPGRVGGAVYMNAGAYGREIADLFSECRLYDTDSAEIVQLSSSDLHFSYRKSDLSGSGLILLSAKFHLAEDSSDSIRQRMKYFAQKRRRGQPTNMPSLGSVFKRPEPNRSAGELIDQCGLRGFSIGGAGISEKHAGFIVNLGGATSDEVKSLIALAEFSVYGKFGICLQREIEFLDNGR